MAKKKTEVVDFPITEEVEVPYAGLKPKDLSDAAWTEIVLSWENGLSDREASFRASRSGGVHVTEAQIKEMVESNADISGLRDFLKSALVSQAKLNIAHDLNKGSVSTAKWYLERRAPEEFSSKQAVAFEGAVVGLTMEEKQKELDKLLESFGSSVPEGEGVTCLPDEGDAK